jgi:hypothetical protein
VHKWVILNVAKMPKKELLLELIHLKLYGFPMNFSSKNNHFFKVPEGSWGREGNREELKKFLSEYPDPLLSEMFLGAKRLAHFGLYFHEPLTQSWHQGTCR